MSQQKFEKIVNRHTALMHDYFCLEGQLHTFVKFGREKSPLRLVIASERRGADYYNHLPTLQKSLQGIEQGFLRGRYGKNFFSVLSKKLEYGIEISKDIYRQKDWKQQNESNILRAFQNYRKVADVPYGIMVFSYNLTRALEKEFLDFLFQRLSIHNRTHEINDWVRILTAAPQLTAISKEKLSLFRLIQEILRNKKAVELFLTKSSVVVKNELQKTFPAIFTRLKKHWRQYYWMAVEYVNEPSSIEDYIHTIADLIKNNKKEYFHNTITSLMMHNTTIQAKTQIFIKRFSCNQKGQKYISTMSQAGYFFDHAKLALVKMNFFTKPFIEEIGRRMGGSWIDTMYYFPEELEQFLKREKKLSSTTIKERKKKGVFMIKGNKIQYLTGKSAEDFIRKNIHKERVDMKIKSISGITAYKGIMRGKVKIITNSSDQSKMQSGDILVAKNTTPEFLPSIRKAAAIITDEGGILTHAAIISREMKIPCIVGTKIATKILRDGSVVEVDANRGVISLINN